MSIFAMNYFNDISEYDQSVVDFNQKGIKDLRRKSQQVRNQDRLAKTQTFVKQKAQTDGKFISDTESKIIEEAVTHKKQGTKADLNFQFIKVYQNKFNRKSKIEDLSDLPHLANSGSDSEDERNQIKSLEKDEKLDPKEELYLKIIKKRGEKLQKVQKQYYFFDRNGV